MRGGGRWEGVRGGGGGIHGGKDGSERGREVGYTVVRMGVRGSEKQGR